MRLTAWFASVWLLGGSLAFAQDKLQEFAGTWKAEFHKQTWLILTLRPNSGTLTGELSHSIQISADDKGEITSVGEEMSNDKISSSEVRGATLHITARGPDGNADEYTLVISGPDTADLQPVTASPNRAPKPFHLKRSATEAK